MPDSPSSNTSAELPVHPSNDENAFVHQVAAKAVRKLRAQREEKQGVWFGLGMSGLIGWSVAVPTLAGAIAGLWWDRHHPDSHSWTLMLMFAGLVIGCANAWHWIAQQDQAMQEGAVQKKTTQEPLEKKDG